VLDWPLATAEIPRESTGVGEESADQELVVAALDGQDDAFAELIRRHKPRVFATASRFARDGHQLEDICQEVFVRAFRNLGKFRNEAPFHHWLARITTSACYDFLRRERRNREQVSLDGSELQICDAGVEAALSAGRARELLAWALRQLTADEQLILTLCEIEERPLREVAEHTGWSETNVKVRAFRARQNLKKLLQEHHER
jgi:RNA polymerase sigma-70 factor (ECF subfamily)